MGTLIRMLIVDDEPNIRNGLKCCIDWNELGVNEVFTAKSGAEAYLICQEKRIEILLTDIRMPDIDGLELISRLKYNPLRVIIMSGYADFEYAQRAIGLGVAGYLLKPVKIRELQELVKRLAAEITASRKSKKVLSSEDVPGIQIHQLVFEQNARLNLKENDFDPKLITAFTYANEHYAEQIRISDMAGFLNMSDNYFSSYFKKNTGMSFTDYLTKIRIWHAEDLLKKTTLKIYEISEMVGFSDYRYFNTVFSKQTGMTPSLYKKKLTEN